MKILLNLQVSRVFYFLEHIRFHRALVARFAGRFLKTPATSCQIIQKTAKQK
jgi:hypothetical protein